MFILVRSLYCRIIRVFAFALDMQNWIQCLSNLSQVILYYPQRNVIDGNITYLDFAY